MTKKELVDLFSRDILPSLKAAHEYGGQGINYPIRAAKWKDYLKYARDCGWITEIQYSSWGIPSICKQ